MKKKILQVIYSFFTNRENLYRGVFLILIFIILTANSSVSFAIIMSSIISSFSSNFVDKIEKKIKIPRSISAIAIVIMIATSSFYLFKKIIVLIVVQSSKILSLIENKDFIESKIDKFDKFMAVISDNILSFKGRASNMPRGLKKIDDFIDNLPDLLIHKFINFVKPLIEKSYVPGLKLLNFGYTFVIFLVFLFFFIKDWRKIKNFLKYSIGYEYNKKLHQIIDYLKETIIVIFFSQIKVALILTVLYSIVLYSVNFEYFLIYAICFSFFTLVPVIGYCCSFLILAFSCFIFEYSIIYSIKLLAILFCGMLVENLILTPKFVGSSINAHPLAILICLLILPSFFGIFGVILVLPFVAVLSKIISYMQDELDKSVKLKNLEENGES